MISIEFPNITLTVFNVVDKKGCYTNCFDRYYNNFLLFFRSIYE